MNGLAWARNQLRRRQRTAASGDLRRKWLLLVTASLISCTDGPTLPSRTTQPTAPSRGITSTAEAFGLDTIRIIETIDRQGGPDSASSHTVRVRSRLMGVVTAQHGDAPVLTRSPAIDTIQQMLDRTLDADLSIPTGPVPSMPSLAKHWTKSAPYGGESTLFTEGDGNAPISELRLVTDGVVRLKVSQHYQRGPYSWDLTERTITTPTGTYHVTVTRSAPPSDPKQRLGLVRAPNLNMLAKQPPTSLNFLNQPVHGLDVIDDPCTGDNYENPGPCAGKKAKMDDAYTDYLIALAEEFGACALVPPPIDWYTCALATAKYLVDTSRYNKARDDYNLCVVLYRAACGCADEESVGTAPVGVAPIGGRDPRLGARGPQPGGRVQESCVFDPPPDDDSSIAGSGSGDGEDTTYYDCYFWVTWDEYGDVTSATLLYCVQEQ